MLIKFYTPTKHKCFNNTDIQSILNQLTYQYKNITYPTKPIPDTFENISTNEILQLIDKQYKFIKEEADILLKYNQLTKKAYDITLDQYKNFFYYDQHFYKIQDIKTFITQENNELNTYIEQQPTTIQELKKTITISRDAIRTLTGYSPYFTPTKWEGPETYVKRQDDLIKDENDLILVLANRQAGKSYTISEKAIEESHIPNNDILVGAFTTSSTHNIRNYLRRLIKKFPEGYWDENKAERFIQNLKTGSKIYFRTLADDAVDSIRGMTLNTILIDESQLVSEYAFVEVLEPTLATTGGKMVLIGTPPKVPSGYFVEQIFKYKRGELKNVSYYEIKLPDQPFTHPKVRVKVLENQDDPRVQRERFCNLSTDMELLFQFQKSTQFPIINKDSFYVIGIDPARKKDRSGYSVIQINSGKATVVESGFIPDTFKSDWKLQTIYLKKIRDKYNVNPENFITVIDSSGVGDGVMKIFQDMGLNIKYSVRYTSGLTKTLKNTDYTVAKSVLINNLLDMISENQIEVVDILNKDLLEEVKYIYETESRTGIISFTSKFFDDVTNATMIAAFIVNEKKLISRSLNVDTTKQLQSSGSQFIDAIEGRGRNKNNYTSSMW